MHDIQTARFEDYQLQQNMAGYVGGSFLPPPAEQQASPPRVLAAASSNLPPILKASRHDESQTTPRQKAHTAAAAQQDMRRPPPKYGSGHNAVNIDASAVGAYAQRAGFAEQGAVRLGQGLGGATNARMALPASSSAAPFGQGAAEAAAAGQGGSRYTHGSSAHSAAELLNSLTGMTGGAGDAVRAAASQGARGAAAPKPLQLPAVFASNGVQPLPTARKAQPPPNSSRQPLTSRAVPMGGSPYLQAVPGFNPARTAASLPPAAGAYAGARTARGPAPVQLAGFRPVQQPQDSMGLPLPPPALPTVAQAAGAPPALPAVPQTARNGKNDVYARMSQGLPAIETPRTARAQQLLRQPLPSQPVPMDTSGGPLLPPQQLLQQLGQGKPHQLSYVGQTAIPLGSPTASTGLTPRTARLMQGPGTRAQQQQQQPPQQQPSYLRPPPGLPAAPAAQQQGMSYPSGSAWEQAPAQAFPQHRYNPPLATGGGSEPRKQGPYNPLAGDKWQKQVDHQDAGTDVRIKALHAPPAAPVGLAALQPHMLSSIPIPVHLSNTEEASAVQHAYQSSAAAFPAGGNSMGSSEEDVGSLAAPPEEAGEEAVYTLQPQQSGPGALGGLSRPHQPIPPSTILAMELPEQPSSMHSMPQLYYPQQAAAAESQHASHSAEVYLAEAAEAEAAAAAAAAAPAAGAGAGYYVQQPAAYAASSRKPSYQDESAGPAVQPVPVSRPPSVPSDRATPVRRGISGIHALRQFEALLTPFEQSEILGIPEVWFVGRQHASKVSGDKGSSEPNCGYDDSRGDYLTVVGDHIAFRYEVLEVLGRGSFGQVLRCLDHATGQGVALKIIRNKRRFQKQAAIEAEILHKLQALDPHDTVNIVRTYTSFHFRNHLCITFELLSLNLYEYIKSNNFKGSGLSTIRRIAAQVLQCLQFLIGQRIVHCDLKPENICLVERGRSRVKLIDFGSSCYVDQRMYTYIQSRFYRSPEVILGLPYGPPIDMWSLGCILAELLTGQPLFPGEDEKEQLACIMEIMGPPPLSILQGATRANIFFTRVPLPCPANSRGKTHRPGTLPLEAALKGCSDPLFLDFLRRCLEWEPERRMTPGEALQHEWIARGSSASGRTSQLYQAASRLGSTSGAPGLYYHHSQGGGSVSGGQL